MFNIERMQYKWDVCLLTNFFERQNYRIYGIFFDFCRKNEISKEDSILLKRTPIIDKSFVYRTTDVYLFVASRLVPLYKFVESKDITDVFDIANDLKGSNINTTGNVSYLDVAKERSQTRRNEKMLNRDRKFFSEFIDSVNEGNRRMGVKVRAIR